VVAIGTHRVLPDLVVSPTQAHDFHRAIARDEGGTRELVLAPLPFVAVYEVLENEVQVLRILHGAQQWPPP